MRRHGTITHLRPEPPYRMHPMWAIEADPNTMVRLKRMFPKLRPDQRGVVGIIDTPEVARDLEWTMERYRFAISQRHHAHLRQRAADHRRTEQIVDSILAGERPATLLPREPTFTPFPEQQVACDMLLATGRLLLADEVGLGKTFAALLPMCVEDTLPAVVVAPPGLLRQWREEIIEGFPFLRPHIVRKGALYNPAHMREMAGHQPDVYLISYYMLRGWVDHLAAVCKYAVFEEMHELRHPNTDKYTHCSQLARAMTFKLGVTATPVYNYGGEAHTVVSLLDEDALGSRQEFIREWGASEVDRGDKQKVGDPARLGRHLRDTGLMLRRRRKKQPPQRIPHLIDCDEHELERVAADTRELAQLIVSGAGTPTERRDASKDIDWRVRQATGIAKAPYVASFSKLLLDSEDKLVIWGWHRRVYDIWQDRLADFNPLMYTGTESNAAKHAAKQAFIEPLERDTRGNPDPDAHRVLIMSLASGAGLDGLQKVANVGVFGELDWSPAKHLQALGRIDPTRGLRPDEDATHVGSAVGYFLWTDSGSDPVVMDVLNVKRMQAEPLVDPDDDMGLDAHAGQDTSNRIRRLAAAMLKR